MLKDVFTLFHTRAKKILGQVLTAFSECKTDIKRISKLLISLKIDVSESQKEKKCSRRDGWTADERPRKIESRSICRKPLLSTQQWPLQ